MLHPKDTLPTNMGFHHSLFTVRILTVGCFGAAPNGPPKIVVTLFLPEKVVQ